MDIRSIKKEVEALPHIPSHAQTMQRTFLKPLKSTFLADLPFEARSMANLHLGLLRKELAQAKEAQSINSRLSQQARCLVELKLSLFQENEEKYLFLRNQMLQDDVFNIQQTITDIQTFREQAKRVQHHYSSIIELLDRHLSLENNLLFQEYSHKKDVQALLNVAEQQKNLIHDLGKAFIMLAKR